MVLWHVSPVVPVNTLTTTYFLSITGSASVWKMRCWLGQNFESYICCSSGAVPKETFMVLLKKQNKTQSSEASHTPLSHPIPCPKKTLAENNRRALGLCWYWQQKHIQLFSLNKRTFFKSFKASHTKAIMSLPHFTLCSQNHSRKAGLN